MVGPRHQEWWRSHQRGFLLIRGLNQLDHKVCGRLIHLRPAHFCLMIYRIKPSIGLDAVAYNLRGIRPDRAAR